MSALTKVLTMDEVSISEFLPFSYHISQHVISLSCHEFMTVIRMAGRSHQTADEEDIYKWIADLNMVMKNQCSDAIEVCSYVVRRRMEHYPGGEFKNIFACEFNEQYKKNFSGGNLYINDLYLCIIYRPITNKLLATMASKEKNSIEQISAFQEQAIEKLMAATSAFVKALRPYRAELLGIEKRNGALYSSAMEHFGFILNGRWADVPVTKYRLSEVLPKSQIRFSRRGDVGETNSIYGSGFFGMVEIRDYDSETVPGNLNWLLESKFELVICNTFSAISSAASESSLKRHQKMMIDAKDVGESQIRGINQALDRLKDKQFIMGEHHCTVLVRGETPQAVRDMMGDVIEDLGRCKLLCTPLDKTLEAGFWAQFPGNRRFRPRPAPITSENFLDLSSFHNFMIGKATGNPWGDAVTVLKSEAGAPVYVNFHETPLEKDNTGDRPLGHSLLLGKSGAGKTTLLAALLAQATKYNPTMWLFDKDYSLKILVKALDGEYFSLERGRPSGLNPLQLSPTPKNILFLKKLIKTCVRSDGYGLLPKEDQQIDMAISTVMDLPAQQRRFGVLLQAIPDVKSDDVNARASLNMRLKKWCEGGDNGWLFDNPTDKLSLNNTIYGFDVTDFLDEPDIRPVLMMYLTFRADELIDGRPFIYGFEEFWKLAEDEFFIDLCKDELKTIRKKNGICLFSTQEPDDALACAIGKTIIQQLATIICLRNDKAKRDDYVDGLGLTNTEFELIKGFSETERKLLIKQGGNSAIANFDLGNGMGNLIKVLSGTPDNAALMDDIISSVGNKAKDWLHQFYARAQ